MIKVHGFKVWKRKKMYGPQGDNLFCAHFVFKYITDDHFLTPCTIKFTFSSKSAESEDKASRWVRSAGLEFHNRVLWVLLLFCALCPKIKTVMTSARTVQTHTFIFVFHMELTCKTGILFYFSFNFQHEVASITLHTYLILKI